MCRTHVATTEIAARIRYLTIRYITRPIVVASIGTISHLPSLDATLREPSCSSMSCSESTDLWHMGHLVMHAVQRSKADRCIVYTRASLDACTWKLWFSLDILEQGDCLGCNRTFAWQLVSKCCSLQQVVAPGCFPSVPSVSHPHCASHEKSPPSCASSTTLCCLSEPYRIDFCARDNRKSCVV
jgi:hypothetical protein